jgi:hypothetical protein
MAAVLIPSPLIPEIHQHINQENQAGTIEQNKNIQSHWMFSQQQLGSD